MLILDELLLLGPQNDGSFLARFQKPKVSLSRFGSIRLKLTIVVCHLGTVCRGEEGGSNSSEEGFRGPICEFTRSLVGASDLSTSCQFRQRKRGKRPLPAAEDDQANKKPKKELCESVELFRSKALTDLSQWNEQRLTRRKSLNTSQEC